MLTVWGRTSSTNVQKVAWLIEELGLEVDRKDVGGPFGGLDTPEYIAMNPNQLIPTLQDGDLTIWESEAILRYLAGKYGTQFYPTDLAKRAMVDQWMCWNQSTWFPAVGAPFVTVVKTPVAERDANLLQKQVDFAASKAALIEEQLKKHDYIAGNDLTLADFSFAAWLFRYYTLEINRPKLDNLQKYYDRLCQRPAYVKHVHVSYDFMRVPGAEKP